MLVARRIVSGASLVSKSWAALSIALIDLWASLYIVVMREIVSLVTTNLASSLSATPWPLNLTSLYPCHE